MARTAWEALEIDEKRLDRPEAWPTDVLKLICESIFRVTRQQCKREFISVVKAQMAISSENTGHGRAQRAFAGKILEAIKGGDAT